MVEGNIADKECINRLFDTYKPDLVVNLAAQAGVRYSITNQDSYIESNLIGFYNILEACRHSYDNGQAGVQHLVYASSSSVYGSNKKVPYSTHKRGLTPLKKYKLFKWGTVCQYYGIRSRCIFAACYHYAKCGICSP